jgi:hypothetical protein
MLTRIVESAQNSRYEYLLQAGGPGGVRLAAASLRARQDVAAASDDERAIRDVGAGVAGPLLVAYVHAHPELRGQRGRT